MTDTHEPLAPLVDRPQSYEDMQARAAFIAPLDHQQHALKAVLTDYHFPKVAPCGLKGCRQPHNNGFLVITEDDVETNVGKVCGRTFFGDEVFSTVHADYQRRRQRADLIQRFRSLQAEADPIADRLKDVVFRQYGGKWVRKVEAALTNVLGEGLMSSLEAAHLRRELTVSRAVERTEEEVQNAMALTPGLSRELAKYSTESVGVLESMPWIGFDFRQRLLGRFVEALRSFTSLDPEQLATPKVRALVKPFAELDAEVAAAEEAAASALRFLAEENLSLVAIWLPPPLKDRAERLREWASSPARAALLTGEPG
jgi:hypothetical protein